VTQEKVKALLTLYLTWPLYLPCFVQGWYLQTILQWNLRRAVLLTCKAIPSSRTRSILCSFCIFSRLSDIRFLLGLVPEAGALEDSSAYCIWTSYAGYAPPSYGYYLYEYDAICIGWRGASGRRWRKRNRLKTRKIIWLESILRRRRLKLNEDEFRLNCQSALIQTIPSLTSCLWMCLNNQLCFLCSLPFKASSIFHENTQGREWERTKMCKLFEFLQL